MENPLFPTGECRYNGELTFTECVTLHLPKEYIKDYGWLLEEAFEHEIIPDKIKPWIQAQITYLISQDCAKDAQEAKQIRDEVENRILAQAQYLLPKD